MFTTFVDKLSGLFDGRFLIAFWGPVFIATALGSGLWVSQVGVSTASAWWDGQSSTQQWMTGLAVLLVITILAFVLQALTTPLVRLYEGYWPNWLGWLQRWCASAEKDHRQKLLQNEQWRAAFYGYPSDEQFVRATRLGNTMTAAEEYSYFIYRADAIIWWPRLSVLLPEPLRSQIDAAFTPVVALLNLCTVFFLWAVIGAGWLVISTSAAWLFALVFAGGLLAAWTCYRAAITQAEAYGDLIRAAFDLHRRDLLAKLDMSLPDNLVDEQRLWIKLGRLHYYRTFPWVPLHEPAPAPLPDDPLYYDTHKPPSPAPIAKPQTLNVTLQGTPTVVVRQKGEH
jgi:hypothetical protein